MLAGFSQSRSLTRSKLRRNLRSSPFGCYFHFGINSPEAYTAGGASLGEKVQMRLSSSKFSSGASSQDARIFIAWAAPLEGFDILPYPLRIIDDSANRRESAGLISLKYSSIYSRNSFNVMPDFPCCISTRLALALNAEPKG